MLKGLPVCYYAGEVNKWEFLNVLCSLIS